MTISSIIFFAVLAFFVLLPVFWACRFVWLYESRLPGRTARIYCPKVAVILTLRGNDPSLKACLQGILNQEYRRYSVWVVIDNEEDPACRVVSECLTQFGGAHVEVKIRFLEQRRETCSLKVSSQLQAIRALDPSVEVVAFIDADSVPAPDWLSSMVAPLADARVGATSGIRWFAPPDTKWGSLVRHLYNAASFTQMYIFHIPWGGSLAIRAALLRDSDLLDHWSNCFCEDTSCYGVLRDHGLKLAFVPEATNINRESIDFDRCQNFVMRQLLCVRLHHVHWNAIFLTNLGHSLALAASFMMVLHEVSAGNWLAARAYFALLAAYTVAMTAALSRVEVLIRRVLSERGKNVPIPSFSTKMLLAGPLTQAISTGMLIGTFLIRKINWRGITYSIDGPERIRLAGYGPMATEPGRIDAEHSVI